MSLARVRADMVVYALLIFTINRESLMSNSHVDVIVLGAGASGLMLAAHAAKRGRSVLILEKANKIGKRF